MAPVTLLPDYSPGATEVTVWSLQMHHRDQVRPARRPAVEVLLMQAGGPAPELSRFFYESIGAAWHWVDLAGWDRDEWLACVDRP